MYKAFFLFLVTVIWVILMILLIKPGTINIYLLQLCLEKETSWQAKEGAVMCKFCNILSTAKPRHFFSRK